MRATKDWKNKWNYLKKKNSQRNILATSYVSWQQVSDMIGYEKKNIGSFLEIRNVHQSAKKRCLQIQFQNKFPQCKECEDSSSTVHKIEKKSSVNGEISRYKFTRDKVENETKLFWHGLRQCGQTN